MNNRVLSAALIYLSGIMFTAFGLLIAVFPEMIVAPISAALILGGIGAVTLAYRRHKWLQRGDWRIIWPSGPHEGEDFSGRVWIRRRW